MTREPHDQHDAGGVQPSDAQGSHGGYHDTHPGYDAAGYGDARYPDGYVAGAGTGYGAHGDYATHEGYGTQETYGVHEDYGTPESYGTQEDSYHPAPAPGGWGGEYDADATAFVQLPGPGSGLPDADPLAAPGTGRSGYTPPSLADFEHRGSPGLTEVAAHDPSAPTGLAGTPGVPAAESVHGGPLTPSATTDPSSAGEWTMPLAAATADPAGFGAGPAAGVDSFGADTPQAYVHLGASATDSPAANATAQDAGSSSTPAPSHPQPGGAAAAMGQGAAAALVGSYDAHTPRRPLGVGGAAGRNEEADGAVSGLDLPGPRGTTEPGLPRGNDMDAPPLQVTADPTHFGAVPASGRSAGRDTAQGAATPRRQLADSKARRQVPVPGAPDTDAVSWPESSVISVPRPAGPGPAEQVPHGAPHQEGRPGPGDSASAADPIPYAGSSPGAAAASWPGGGSASSAPQPGDGGAGLPAPRTPEAEGGAGNGLTGPEPGTFATSEGGPAHPHGASPFADSRATATPWPELADVGAPPGTDAAVPEPLPASASALAQSAAAPLSRPAEGSPPSRIPFVASTPGREARPLTSPSTPDATAAADATAGPARGGSVPGGAPRAESARAAGAEAGFPASDGSAGHTPVVGDLPESGEVSDGPLGPHAPHAAAAGDVPDAGASSWPNPGGEGTDAGGQADPGVERHDAPGEQSVEAGGDGQGADPGTPAPAADAWSGAPAGRGPDDSGEYEPARAEPAETAHSEHPHVSYVLRVNGVDRPVTEAWIGESLLYVLRERLGLAGAKDGCSQGECGACSVQVDGRLVAACLVPAATAAGSEVRTVEGLASDGAPSDVQRALAGCGAVQCGFCVPGLAMAVHDLLEGNHAPTELETRQAICGNLCRCSGYRGVLEAVETVVSERAVARAPEAGEEAEAPSEGDDA